MAYGIVTLDWSYNKTGFYKEENVNVRYTIGYKDDYMTCLKGVIEKQLAGDLCRCLFHGHN